MPAASNPANSQYRFVSITFGGNEIGMPVAAGYEEIAQDLPQPGLDVPGPSANAIIRRDCVATISFYEPLYIAPVDTLGDIIMTVRRACRPTGTKICTISSMLARSHGWALDNTNPYARFHQSWRHLGDMVLATSPVAWT